MALFKRRYSSMSLSVELSQGANSTIDVKNLLRGTLEAVQQGDLPAAEGLLVEATKVPVDIDRAILKVGDLILEVHVLKDGTIEAKATPKRGKKLTYFHSGADDSVAVLRVRS